MALMESYGRQGDPATRAAAIAARLRAGKRLQYFDVFTLAPQIPGALGPPTQRTSDDPADGGGGGGALDDTDPVVI